MKLSVCAFISFCTLPSITCSHTRRVCTRNLSFMALNLIDSRPVVMAPGATMTQMTDTVSKCDIAQLQVLLNRKLQGVAENHLPNITLTDVLNQKTKALHVPTLPPDLQLSFFFRNRNSINRDNERPIKDEKRQPLKITRAIFFYHLSEVYQFQRFHDTARWNLAFFTALLSMPSSQSPSTAPHRLQALPKPDAVTPADRRFMMAYLAAVMERHNASTVFEKREEFVRRWKESNLDLFVSFKSAQAKLLRKTMQRLNAEWQVELDKAMRVMGRAGYDARVAPFVGSIVPGRRDQGLQAVAKVLPQGSGDSEEDDTTKERNELLEALRVPLEDRVYQKLDEVQEESGTPVDIRYAITAMQNARPADILPVLVRLFSVEVM